MYSSGDKKSGTFRGERLEEEENVAYKLNFAVSE
jgi:hypothetical protein